MVWAKFHKATRFILSVRFTASLKSVVTGRWRGKDPTCQCCYAECKIGASLVLVSPRRAADRPVCAQHERLVDGTASAILIDYTPSNVCWVESFARAGYKPFRDHLELLFELTYSRSKEESIVSKKKYSGKHKTSPLLTGRDAGTGSRQGCKPQTWHERLKPTNETGSQQLANVGELVVTLFFLPLQNDYTSYTQTKARVESENRLCSECTKQTYANEKKRNRR